MAKQTRDRVDSVQAAAREDRRAVTDLRNQLERLTEKMMDIEDRSRRNNVRLVGLPAGAEGLWTLVQLQRSGERHLIRF